jgi:hypothetical protein
MLEEVQEYQVKLHNNAERMPPERLPKQPYCVTLLEGRTLDIQEDGHNSFTLDP